MKKIMIMILLMLGVYGCDTSSVVSERKMKQALTIMHTELGGDITNWSGEMNFNDIYSLEAIQVFVKSPVFEDSINNMECKLLNTSDVKEKKSTRGCLLKTINSLGSDSKDVLVKAEFHPNNRRIVILKFFSDAKSTASGFEFRYNRLFSVSVAVNLDTQKVGSLN